MTEHLRESVLIHPHAIGPDTVAALMQQIRALPATASLVSDFGTDAGDSDVDWSVNPQVRDTHEVELTAALRASLEAHVDRLITAVIAPFYAVEVCDREPLQVLRYGAGSHYIPHVDAETLFKDDIGLSLWEKTLDRDLSFVLFLNDGFSGGELVFPDLDLEIRPAAGTLVAFPSDHHYIHGVNAVTTGERCTLVTWMRVQGMPTVDEINEQAMAEYERAWPRQILQPPRLRKGGGPARQGTGADVP